MRGRPDQTVMELSVLRGGGGVNIPFLCNDAAVVSAPSPPHCAAGRPRNVTTRADSVHGRRHMRAFGTARAGCAGCAECGKSNGRVGRADDQSFSRLTLRVRRARNCPVGHPGDRCGHRTPPRRIEHHPTSPVPATGRALGTPPRHLPRLGRPRLRPDLLAPLDQID